jgi:phosphopantetheinyl transferase (holo-ACP synthase)
MTTTACPEPSTGRILGVGCDLVHLPTLRRQLSSPIGARFLSNTFTPEELTHCAGDPHQLAQHWAGKEAIAKAIGNGADTLTPRQIELHAGPPWTVRADGPLGWPQHADRWCWALSIAAQTEYVVAFAVASAPDHGQIAPTMHDRFSRSSS